MRLKIKEITTAIIIGPLAESCQKNTAA